MSASPIGKNYIAFIINQNTLKIFYKCNRITKVVATTFCRNY